MITDIQTNKLYLSDVLELECPEFYPRFTQVLKDCKIPFELLPGTKDIWAVDYMPIQISLNHFVQFTYNPDYLQKEFKYTISNVDAICKAIHLKPIKSNLVIDGGNIVRTRDKLLMCDKVFRENPHIPQKELIRQLREIFQIDHLCFVPWDKSEITGHADGMVRFIDNDKVLVNDYSVIDKNFHNHVLMALHNAGLDWIELPYSPPKDLKSESAEGLYLNYLQMEQAIIMPTFNDDKDEKALRILEQVFRGQTIKTIESRQLSEKGGILNCISWNIAV